MAQQKPVDRVAQLISSLAETPDSSRDQLKSLASKVLFALFLNNFSASQDDCRNCLSLTRRLPITLTLN